MFEVPSLDEAALQEIAEIEAQRAVYRRKEALQLYYTLSRDFRDAFSEPRYLRARACLYELRELPGYRVALEGVNDRGSVAGLPAATVPDVRHVKPPVALLRV